MPTLGEFLEGLIAMIDVPTAYVPVSALPSDDGAWIAELDE